MSMKKPDFPIPWEKALKGSKLAIENAERLANDAAVLKQNDRLESAYYVSLNAWEELGKAVLLFRHWKEKQDISEKQWHKIFRNHTIKRVAYTENFDALYPKSTPPMDMEEVLEKMKKVSKERGRYFDFERQIGLYVDWVGEWRSPSMIDRRFIDSFGSDYWINGVLLSSSHLKRVISESEKEQPSNH